MAVAGSLELTVKHPKCRMAKVVSRFAPKAAAALALRYHVTMFINGELFWRGTIGEMMDDDVLQTLRG